jgi:ubiquinol-cytochrome c reductase cytochrome b/c1 subunit
MAVTRAIPALALSLAMFAAPALAQEHSHDAPPPPKQSWSFAGPFGKFDRGQLQRGFKVYREVCLQCHGMQLLSFRNLAEPGGPGFTPEQAAVVASEYKYKDKDDQGNEIERAGRPADRFPPPLTRFPTAVPPDLSVIAKARGYERGFPKWIGDVFMQYQEHGADYIVAYLTGYEDPPAGFTAPQGLIYNKYFPGHATAMPPPAFSTVEYTDGTPTTPLQYAKDVTAFLMWAAEPHMEARKRIGLQVMVFLIVFAVLLYFTKKRVWHDVQRHPEILEQKRAPTEYPKA